MTSYNVYRGISAGGEGSTAVGTVNGTTLSFTDTGLTNGTTYYYTVKAVNSAGTSSASNEANATPTAVTATAPTAPQSLTAAWRQQLGAALVERPVLQWRLADHRLQRVPRHQRRR